MTQEELESRIVATYRQAESDVKTTWQDYLARQEERLKPLQEAYDAAKASGDKDEMRRTGIALSRAKKKVTVANAHFQNMVKSMASRYNNAAQVSSAYINDTLPQSYIGTYNASGMKIAKDVSDEGYSFSLVDESTVKNLLTNDSSLLPQVHIDETKQVKWDTQSINAQVLQGILQGETMTEISHRIANVTTANEVQAIRAARTATTGAENKGRQDSYLTATNDGVILKKQWLCIHDSRTRHSHFLLDGETVAQNKKFSNGLMYPADPSGKAEEIYNCRCTMVAIVEGYEPKADFSSLKGQLQDKTISSLEKILDASGNTDMIRFFSNNANKVRISDNKYTDKKLYKKNEGIYFNEETIGIQNGKKLPYQSLFHEMTHNIMWEGNADYSYTYKGNKLGKTMRQDFISIMEEYAGGRDFHGNSIKNMSSEELASLAAEWKKTLSSEERQKNWVISDAIQSQTGLALFGYGHEPGYYKNASQAPSEFVAKYCECAAANAESLETLKSYFPKSCKVALDIIREMMK